uniref:Putative homing endonuclease n=1 Tax=viral metagenome TaxID=1070528 RepID=A0A6M3XUW8_9ZZZZ
MPEITIPNNWRPRLDQMLLWEYMEAGGLRACEVAHRRWGKDDVALHYTATALIQRPGNYWHMLPQYNQARKVIWDAVNPRTGKKRIDEAFPVEIRKQARRNEMSIEFINGAIWQLVGSDNYNAYVGSPPLGIVLSEWAVANPMAWAFLSPILEENGGWAIFIYCVSPDTLVFTEDGIVEIGAICENDGYSNINIDVYGLNNFDRACQYFRNPDITTPVLKITTEKGYEIVCTYDHRIWTGENWKAARDLEVGGTIPIQHSQGVFGSKVDWNGFCLDNHGHNKGIPFEPGSDFYYFLGLYVAEGYNSGRNIVITIGDDEPHDFLSKHGFVRYIRKDQSVASNTNLCKLVRWFGCGDGALNKQVPPMVLQSPEWAQIAFLQGYFDGDGCATKKGTVHCDSISSKLIKTIQIMLLNFGIFSRKTIYTKLSKSTQYNIYGKYPCWRLEIDELDAGAFFSKVGFRLNRKQNRGQADRVQNQLIYVDYEKLEPNYFKGLNEGDTKRQFRDGTIRLNTIKRLNDIKESLYLTSLINEAKKYRYLKIVDIQESQSEVVDFVIPKTHSFTSNGFISHNTSRGNNHGFTMYEHACAQPDWHAEKLTALETPVFTEIQLAKIKAEYIQIYGLDLGTALYEQEYLCSFDSAVPGAYFGAEIAAARAEGRITKIPYEPDIPVNTFWDLGIDDSMTIWFHQAIPSLGQHRFIDYYEVSGVGLAACANVLHEKREANGWMYSRHVAPHDIKVRELISGKSRWESARRLLENGEAKMSIDFEIAHRPENKEDAIEVSRQILKSCWFDADKCKGGINALSSYSKKWDELNHVWSKTPDHSWACHGADGFQTFSIAYNVFAESVDDLRVVFG